ncbi:MULTISPECIES: hypothetical protein [Mesorhizobium]|uniref:hypothetical protein n=1 Tax=Mesorhizobium TaxID=68287 RepID=UPI0015611461|nr:MULTISPECIES: hypothetical protein [Mesorhizobium]
MTARELGRVIASDNASEFILNAMLSRAGQNRSNVITLRTARRHRHVARRAATPRGGTGVRAGSVLRAADIDRRAVQLAGGMIDTANQMLKEMPDRRISRAGSSALPILYRTIWVIVGAR